MNYLGTVNKSIDIDSTESPESVEHIHPNQRYQTASGDEKSQKLQVLYEQWNLAEENWNNSQLVVRMRQSERTRKVGGRRWMTRQMIHERYGEELAQDIMQSKNKQDPERKGVMVKPHPDIDKESLFLCWDESFESTENDELIELMYEGWQGDKPGKSSKKNDSQSKKHSKKRKASSSSESDSSQSSEESSSSSSASKKKKSKKKSRKAASKKKVDKKKKADKKKKSSNSSSQSGSSSDEDEEQKRKNAEKKEQEDEKKRLKEAEKQAEKDRKEEIKRQKDQEKKDEKERKDKEKELKKQADKEKNDKRSKAKKALLLVEHACTHVVCGCLTWMAFIQLQMQTLT